MKVLSLKPAGSKVAFQQASAKPSRATRQVVCNAEGLKAFAKNASQKAAVLAASALIAGSANALSFDELQGLTYLQVKGSGIANTCPTIDAGSSNVKDLKAGSYKCPVLSRSTAAAMLSSRKRMALITPPSTVQLPGGERVPFLFTVKELVAKGTADGFGGEFTVPSYRGATFLDPKGRGAASGYERAEALPGRGDQEELAKENAKNAGALKGQAVFSIAKVDPATGEIAGVFESIQPSDTDLGAKAPKDVKIQGLWYAQLS
ncbi:hypothetical protein Ndes2526B_g00774 [Nannochloris sp. 'desiccata']